jgi:GNAT superfamily N-acetyltransferase
MTVVPLRQDLIPQVMDLMALGEPYITVRTASDYWLYATLFSPTCPVAVEDDRVVGAVVAFRSQDDPDEVYVQDVMTHPDHRRRGLARDSGHGPASEGQLLGVHPGVPDLRAGRHRCPHRLARPRVRQPPRGPGRRRSAGPPPTFRAPARIGPSTACTWDEVWKARRVPAMRRLRAARTTPPFDSTRCGYRGGSPA